MMLPWKLKLNIFTRAIKTRMKTEQRTAEDIITEYVLLTEDEKAEILSNLRSLNNIGGE